MSTTRSERNESFKKAFVIKAIPFLKSIFAKTQLGYNSIDVKSTCDKHEIPTNAVPTMVDLGILKMQGEKRSAMYHWKGGLISDDMAARIYERIQMNKQHAKIKKKMEEQHDNKLSSKKLVKVIGSKRPVEFKNDHEAAAILRSMVEVYAGTKNKGMKTAGMILEIIRKEVNNDTLADRILKGLVDGNYITVNKNLNTIDLYTWNEDEPNEEHALFMKDMIKETVGDDRPNRIFNFLMYLYKFKTFTHAKLRSEVVKFNLTYNDQSVITADVLEFRGSKIDREYKWKLSEAPSIQLAEVLDRKVKAYGAKYKKDYTPKKESPKMDKHVKEEKPKTVGTTNYGASTLTVLEYLKTHDQMTTDEACELLKQDKHTISNIFWRLCKDKLTYRVKMKTYAMVGNSAPVKKEEPVVVVQHVNKEVMTHDNDFLSSLKSALDTMREKEIKLTRELNDVKEKIKEGEDLLALKEREHSYMASIGKFIGKKKNPVIDQISTALIKSQDNGRKRHAHDKQTILDTLNRKEQVTLDEFIEIFYPGKGLNWNSDEVKSLSAMIYSLKKDGKIESPEKAIYKLKK